MQGSKGNKQLERDMQGDERGGEKLAPEEDRPLVSGIGRIALMVALALVLIAGVSAGAVAIIKNTNFGNSPTTIRNTGNSTSPGNSSLATNANGVVNFIDAPGGAGH